MISMLPLNKKSRILLVCGALLVGAVLIGGAVAWLERSRLLTWYYVQGLNRANEGERETWVQPIVQMDSAAVPGLIDNLDVEDVQACANTRTALARLVTQWGMDDLRTADLAKRLVRAFPRMSLAGKLNVLALAHSWLLAGQETGFPDRIRSRIDDLLSVAAGTEDTQVHGRALDVAELLVEREQGKDTSAACQELIRCCLRDAEQENRLRAVMLIQSGPRQLLQEVVPLLHDPEAEVRRAAIVAVGPDSELISTDELLHYLHDPDKEVRQLCEAALRARHLSEEHLELGRLITDERPVVRLQVLAHLNDDDLEPGVWLRRLTEDPVPAVRVAALRAAAEQSVVDLTDRIEQLAGSDPSPTVCQLARYYLSCRKPQSPNLSKP